MSRLSFLAVALTAALVVVPAPANAAGCGDGSTGYAESFEEGFAGWVPKSDGKVKDNDWKVMRSGETACHGKVGLRYDVNGRGDDGTVWVQRDFAVEPGASSVDLSFWVSSKQKSIVGWPVVAYVGAQGPSREQDFTIVGKLDEWIGWKRFGLSRAVPPGADVVTIAFGVSVTWETPRSDFLDYAQVGFRKAPNP